MARINQLPKEKLVSPLDNQRGAILYYIGSFSPFHQGHLNIMKQAEQIAAKTHQVIGGYISPTHPSALYKSNQADDMEWIPTSTRTHLAQLGVEDQSLWMIDLSV